MVNTNRLKGAIVSAGYTQATFAELLGVSKNTLNAKLNGKASITTEEAKRMCDILNISNDADKCQIFLI